MKIVVGHYICIAVKKLHLLFVSSFLKEIENKDYTVCQVEWGLYSGLYYLEKNYIS